MLKFKDWFNGNLEVGFFPMLFNDDRKDYSDYDVVINVSDEYYPEIDLRLKFECGCATHWFPMNECGHDNGINSIYGACYILRLAEQRGLKVYLHCHAGKHRSRIVQAAYYFMRTNHHFNGYRYNGFETAMHYDCENGTLPPIKEMESFLGKMSKTTARIQWKGVSGSLDNAKIGYVHSYKLSRAKRMIKNTNT